MRTLQITIALGALLAAGCGSAGLDRESSSTEVGESADGDDTPALSDLAEDETGELSASSCTLSPPRSGLWAKFRVASGESFEIYRSRIANAQGIRQAIALWRGTSSATIPIAPLICRQRSWNCPWKFIQDPTQLTFADFAIEVCDGTPSFVNANCADFGAGSYCPWSAVLVDLRDCRSNPACPRVPR